jgi:DNA-binding NtrC family response regulator
MQEESQLNSDERNFFSLVERAGLANPFSRERMDIELKIAGMFPDAQGSDRVNQTVHEVKRRIASLESRQIADINLFSGKEHSQVRAAFLFEFFYDFRKKFDELISKQMDAGETPVKVSFAGDALGLLRQRGFDPEDSRRYFALSYQLRRAYFFICRNLIGRSPAMQNLRFNLWNNVFTHNLEMYDKYLWNRMEDFSTLLLGETGTGKGTAAASIGRSGFIPYNEKKRYFEESFTRAFVSLNLSQHPESLIESELFGHRKGAFTGAVKNYRGIFNRCSPFGAILLDEIGEVSPPVQIKLLQVLQERVFTPVGSHEPSRFQGRVIAATNRSLHQIKDEKIFRSDFYYRLCSDIITVPPLRERIQENPNEIDDLLAFTLEKMVGRPSPELTEIVKQVIDRQLGSEYPWHGNVRELEQCVRRVLLKCSYDGDKKSHVPEDLLSKLTSGIGDGIIPVQDLVSGYCDLLYRRFGTFEEVARRTHLDRRTVKKYIQEQGAASGEKPSG